MEDNEYKRQSKDRLERIICKKVTTTMIGALHAFEEQFAHMWENNIKMKDK
jgi:hypothetical protein